MSPTEDDRASHGGEVALFDLSGWLIASADVAGLAEEGLLRVRVPADKLAGAPSGRQVRIQLSVEAGEVRCLAEVARVDGGRHELVLRLLQVENDEGLPRLVSFLHAWLTRTP